jgi:hypothetical protein
MGYLKLKKAGGSCDLIPADNIIYVKGTEGAASTATGQDPANGLAPFVEIVQGFATADADKLAANKVIVGPATGVAATTTCKKIMQDAVNDAIIKAAQAEGLVVEVDFSGVLSDANYTGANADVTSAAPILYDVTPA